MRQSDFFPLPVIEASRLRSGMIAQQEFPLAVEIDRPARRFHGE